MLICARIGIRRGLISGAIAVVLLAALAAAFASAAAAAPGDQAWVKKYLPAGGWSTMNVLVATAPTGDIYVAASVKALASPHKGSLMVARYASSGSRKWAKTYSVGGSFDNVPTALVPDSDGNVIVAGYTSSASAGEDWLLVRYTRGGQRSWVRRAGRSGVDDRIVGAVTSGSGRVVVAGQTAVSATDTNWMVSECRPNGTWTWRYTRANLAGMWDSPVAIARGADGSLYITGYDTTIAGDADAVLVKLRRNGSSSWVRTWSSALALHDRPADVAVSSAGVAVVGRRDTGGSTSQGLVIKYTLGGVLEWSESYTGVVGGNDWLQAAGIDASGRVFAGGAISTWVDHSDYAVLLWGADGTRLGTQGWLSDPSAIAPGVHDMVVTSDGAAYVTGDLCEASRSLDAYTVAIGADWGPRWFGMYDNAGEAESAWSLALTTSAVYVGASTPGGITLIKYVR